MWGTDSKGARVETRDLIAGCCKAVGGFDMGGHGGGEKRPNNLNFPNKEYF